MRVGAVFPQTEVGADRGGVRAYVEAVRDLGFEHLVAYDHVVGADPAHYVGWSGPYTHETLFHEPFALFGYVAALAPELELVPGVIILPQRQTALVAKQAAEVDVLSGGRLRLGIGIGWNAVEYEALGQDFRARARRFEEQISLLRRLFVEPVVTYEGGFDRITAAGINPLPVQRPIPLWIGGSAEPALRRAARLGDGFFPQHPLEGGWERTMELMRAWVEEAGRDWSSFGVDPRLHLKDGGPDDWRRRAEEWRALGATHISLNTMDGGLAGVDAHLERLRTAKDALDP
jgi:probable F420-dependent oxidoreductase